LSNEENNDKGKRGRPIGFRLSEESKMAISKSKMGQTHRQETKDKISRSLILYFRKRNPLSEEIANIYCRYDDDVCDWVYDVSVELDDLTDVLTDKSMRNSRKMELTCGNNIEYFGHQLTPEAIVLFKEFCEINDVDPEVFIDILMEACIF
jgi:hypothetical protein